MAHGGCRVWSVSFSADGRQVVSGGLDGNVKLSPSTAVYIPIDVFCTYVSTSYIRSTSSTSRLSSGYGDGTSGILAGRRCELYARFPAPAGRGKEPGQRQNPRGKLVELIISRLLLALARCCLP